jgi:putative ABC transport system permease protein
MNTLIHDLRYAARTLAKSPGYAVVAVLTLALGIGANTAIFSVLYGVLLQPLPYPESQRMVVLAEIDHGQYGQVDVTYDGLEFLQQHHGPFEALAGAASVGLNVFVGNRAEHVDALRVSAEYFRVFHAAPALGRSFTAEDDRPDGGRVAVLSHGLWMRQFGGDPGVVGRTAMMDGAPYTVIGVMPAGFVELQQADVWTTLAPAARTVGSGENVEVLARLAPGIGLEQARAVLSALNEEFRRSFPNTLEKEGTLSLFRMQDLAVQDARTPILVLFAAVGLVLLIACANVANMMLGRATARTREMAVRAALGASRGRLVRQLLTESGLVAVTAGAVGLALAGWVLSGLLSLAPEGMLQVASIHLDIRALGFTFGVSLFTGLLFGLAPAFQTSRADLNEPLKEAAGRTTVGGRRGRLRDSLVVGEVALSLILFVGAALLLQTFRNLVRNEPGFDPSRVLSTEIWFSGTSHDTPEKIAALCRELTGRLEAQPGIQAAAVVEAGQPLERGGRTGMALDGVESLGSVDYRSVTPDYFRALGIPLHEGRLFTAADGTGGAPVALVNASFARRIAANAALGHAVRIGSSDQPPRTVVGVVGDVKSFVGQPARPTVFIPVAQTPDRLFRVFEQWFPTHVMVRGAGNPEALRTTVERTLRELDPEVPVGRVRTMEQVLAGSLALQQFLMVLLGALAGLAIVLATIGVYGLMSYMVAQQRHEIGIRLALGASPQDIWRRVVGRGLILSGAGVTLGAGGAFAFTQLLAGILFGVRPDDPLTFASAAAALVAAGTLACAIPASRAARVDPMVALRYE